jgi:sugar O-acyltransferase (sialic acid O-acetyltransferase NeuD family)
MERLTILGSGDLGRLIADYAKNDHHYSVVGFYDDYKQKGEMVDNLPVLGNGQDVISDYQNGLFDCILIAIAYKHFDKRKEYFDFLSDQVPFGRMIHSSSFVNSNCVLGNGVVILPGCILDRNVSIGDNVLLHIGCNIIGGCKIGSHTFLSGGVAMAGFSVIGESCFIGVNSTIIDNIIVGDRVMVGGGAVVIKSINKTGWYVGNPARFLR